MKPLRVQGLPLHPLLVHFPVAAWTVATGLALLAGFWPGQSEEELPGQLPMLALYANLLGIGSGALAMFAGLLELAGMSAERKLREAVSRHLVLAVAAWSIYCVMGVLQAKALLLAAGLAGVFGFMLLVLAGHAGARIVYHHGFPPRQDTQ